MSGAPWLLAATDQWAHLYGDHDYEEAMDDGVGLVADWAPAVRPPLPRIEGLFTVVGTPSTHRPGPRGSEQFVLNLVVVGQRHEHRRRDGRIEAIESPTLRVSLWGEAGESLAARLGDGSVVHVRGYLRTATYHRRREDPLVEVYRPVVVLADDMQPEPREPVRRRPRLGAALQSESDSRFGDEDHDEVPSRKRGEAEHAYIARVADLGWSYDAENDSPFTDAPTPAGFSRDTRFSIS